MDGYFVYDDLIVPKDQGMSSDGFQSANSWSNWGLTSPNTFEFPHEFFLSGMESSIPDGNQTSCSSFEGSFQHKATANSCHRPDYQSNGLAGIENMDDLVMDSLIDDLEEMDNLQPSPCFSSESRSCLNVPAEDLCTEAALDSDSIPSSSMDHDKSRVLESHCNPPHMGTTSLHPLKVPPFSVSVPHVDECMNMEVQNHQKEASREESALQELQLALTHLTTETRICFRDALYRLAKNSRPSEEPDMAMDTPSSTVSVDKISCEGRGMEPETNSIDRTIANLMFNKLDDHVLDYPISTPATSNNEEFASIHEHPQYFTSVHQNQIFPSDVEVLVSGHGG